MRDAIATGAPRRTPRFHGRDAVRSGRIPDNADRISDDAYHAGTLVGFDAPDMLVRDRR